MSTTDTAGSGATGPEPDPSRDRRWSPCVTSHTAEKQSGWYSSNRAPRASLALSDPVPNGTRSDKRLRSRTGAPRRHARGTAYSVCPAGRSPPPPGAGARPGPAHSGAHARPSYCRRCETRRASWPTQSTLEVPKTDLIERRGAVHVGRPRARARMETARPSTRVRAPRCVGSSRGAGGHLHRSSQSTGDPPGPPR